MSNDAEMWREVADEVDAEGERIAKAAMGIPENARILPVNASAAQLFVHLGADGYVRATASISKRDAAGVLRQVADAWDAEWKAAEHAEQKRRRG